MNKLRKILYSPGFGAGWSTWASGDIAKFMLTYEPLIKAIERGDNVAQGNISHVCGFAFDGNTYLLGNLDELHPATAQFVRDCLDKFGEIPYLGGIRDLTVGIGAGPVRVEEYDGSESLHWNDDDEEWL